MQGVLLQSLECENSALRAAPLPQPRGCDNVGQTRALHGLTCLGTCARERSPHHTESVLLCGAVCTQVSLSAFHPVARAAHQAGVRADARRAAIDQVEGDVCLKVTAGRALRACGLTPSCAAVGRGCVTA